MPNKINNSNDLTDSPADESKMQPEISILDLPDVSDIPGQENVTPAPFGDLGDVTMSSADEEGDELFTDDIEDEMEQDNDSNVTPTEKRDLQISSSDMPTEDDINLRSSALDNSDDDGEPLNEGSSKNNISGKDLDVPGAEDDDADEELGEEDEENNDYSLGGDDHDDTPEDNF